ncbi:MAG: HEAT repeat domain-containing protein [Candidatus Moduliflexus flocculans]|nr:HEAT repeat domain-containing protein [Candidatus Moduliflexus flocculans]
MPDGRLFLRCSVACEKATKGPVIARYLYLLDIFDDESWLNELVRITPMRTDLDSAAKTVLLAGLERSGIDIEELPFRASRQRWEIPHLPVFRHFWPKEKQVSSLSWRTLTAFPASTSLSWFARWQPRAGQEPKCFWRSCWGYSDREIVREAIIALGRIRRESAASVLLRYLRHGDGSFRSLAERSLRRLAVLAAFPDPEAGRESEALLSSDGAEFHRGRFSFALVFPPGTVPGVSTFSSCKPMKPAALPMQPAMATSRLRRTMSFSERRWLRKRLVEVSSDYAHAIMRDALYLNTEKGFPIPAEFYVWRRILQADESLPVPFVPDFSPFNLEQISTSTALLRQGIRSLMKSALPDGFPQQGECLILPTNWPRCRKTRLTV